MYRKTLDKKHFFISQGVLRLLYEVACGTDSMEACKDRWQSFLLSNKMILHEERAVEQQKEGNSAPIGAAGVKRAG